MDKLVTQGIYVGDDEACEAWDERNDQQAILHATNTCGDLDDIGYDGKDLFLNIVDSDYATHFNPFMFHVALDWLDMSVAKGKPILIHCNMGGSRSPSIALLWMAKRSHEIPDDSFAAASIAFSHAYYPEYGPGRGIENFLRMNWNSLT